jgi:lipoate-protein ligase A
MPFHLLPTRAAGAAENMAVDFLLLQRYPQPAAVRFRHYTWRGPAVTFGYGQKIAFVREQLVGQERVDLCRRPTGGGMVDHRADWTYALVIPRGHAIEELRAADSYQRVHEALAAALRRQGVAARVKPCAAAGSAGKSCEDSTVSGVALQQAAEVVGPAGLCFQRAEAFDVVHATTGAKIAGAAQKRNKHGLLFQGSVARNVAGGDAVEWEQFQDDFVEALAAALSTSVQPTPWPEFNEDEVEGLTEQYSTAEWVEYR